MSLLEILRALQAGKISPEHAKKEISTELGQVNLKERRSGGERQADFLRLKDNYGLVISAVHSLHELSLQQWVVPEPRADEIRFKLKHRQ